MRAHPAGVSLLLLGGLVLEHLRESLRLGPYIVLLHLRMLILLYTLRGSRVVDGARRHLLLVPMPIRSHGVLQINLDHVHPFVGRAR
jgi:hypothetical protein